MSIFDKLAAVQRSYERLIDQTLREVKARQVSIHRELGDLHLVVDRTDIPL